MSTLPDLLTTERSPRALDEPVRHHDKDLGTFGDLLVDPLAEDAYERTLAAIEINEPILAVKITGPGQRATLSAMLHDGMKAVTIRASDVEGVESHSRDVRRFKDKSQ